MLDIAWPELAVIGAVALVAIGPKDLPKVMHMMGLWAGKARRMVRDVQRSFDQLTYEAEIAEKLKREAEARGEMTASPATSPVSQSASTSPPKAASMTPHAAAPISISVPAGLTSDNPYDKPV